MYTRYMLTNSSLDVWLFNGAINLDGWKCLKLPDLGMIKMFERHLTAAATPSAETSLPSRSRIVVNICVLYNPWRVAMSLPTVSDKHHRPN